MHVTSNENPDDFPIVDPHQHFWDLGRNYYPWLGDPKPIPFRYGDYTALKRNYMPQVRAFPRTRELFERLVGDDVKVALASSAKPHELKHYIEVARIGDLIDAKTAAADVEKTKPDPEVVRVALERLGKPAPAKVRMVGDTPWDVEAAHAAGVACISVLCGGFPEADLKRAGSDGIFEGPADLIESYQRFRATPPLST